MRVVAVLLLIGSSACDAGVFGTGCTAIQVPGIRVDVVDSVSGSSVVGAEGRVVATAGTYADTATFAATGALGPLFVVDDRPGTYRVRVTATGFAPWEQAAVRVTNENKCHVKTVMVVARLQR